MTEQQPTPVLPMLEPLLAVHAATSAGWISDAASTAAERGLGALYSFLFLQDASGHLVGQRPASGERIRALGKVRQALNADLTALKFDPNDRPELIAMLDAGKPVAFGLLTDALPLQSDEKRLEKEQKKLGVSEVWLAPLTRGGEQFGLLVLLMPANPPGDLAHAELLGQHVAVSLKNVQEREANRKLGELDAVRWVYDERRFMEQLTSEVRRAKRHSRPLSIMLLRLSNLDALRGRYGSFLADRILRQIGSRLDDTMRDTDFLGAFHADGFASVLVECDEEGARRAKERLLDSVKTIQLPEADLPDLPIDLACATTFYPDGGETAEEMMASAEARLVDESSSSSAAA
ncbi:MAG: GGDEF domain-containing protein [Dehalococcoidia bacterium]